MKCHVCKGKGEVYSAREGVKTCPKCRGTGHIKKGR
jgi:DnaJ-class molecular chaperone